MNQVKDLHREAMRLVDEAESARRNGNLHLARERIRQAFEHERQAADLVAGDFSQEPTRSVLHQSAASLALDCGALREAERLIAEALSGEPPDEIAEELRDLLEQVYFGGKKGRRSLTRVSDPM
jgi:tetratricopeptide (TPR) repeat protein